MRNETSAENADDIRDVIMRYQKLVYGIALTHLNRSYEVEDIFQEVFLTYYNSNLKFENDEHKKAWFIKTTINFCRRSNMNPWHMRTVRLADENAADEQRFETEEETQVFDALRSLKPRYRIPIYLFYFENMPVEIIACSLHIKKEAVRKRLSRGRQLMKEILECDYFE